MDWRRLKNPGDPPSGTPAEQARWIFARSSDHSFRDGQRVIELLQAGRDRSDLSLEELDLLARGYNWSGKHAEAFGVAKLNLARAPHSQGRFWLEGMYAHNAFCHDLQGFAAACDSQIAEGRGPAAFWQLLKADHYIVYATGEWEAGGLRLVSRGPDSPSRAARPGRGGIGGSPGILARTARG